MYLAIVALTMFILPTISGVIDHVLHPGEPLLAIVGRWFVFWGVGIRLTLAGCRQYLQPSFTAKEIFHMTSAEALPLIRELGVANLATGVVGILSLSFPDFVLPVALSAAIFYGVAGVRHAFERNRSPNENIAMASDIFIALVLAAFAALSLSRRLG